MYIPLERRGGPPKSTNAGSGSLGYVTATSPGPNVIVGPIAYPSPDNSPTDGDVPDLAVPTLVAVPLKTDSVLNTIAVPVYLSKSTKTSSTVVSSVSTTGNAPGMSVWTIVLIVLGCIAAFLLIVVTAVKAGQEYRKKRDRGFHRTQNFMVERRSRVLSPSPSVRNLISSGGKRDDDSASFSTVGEGGRGGNRSPFLPPARSMRSYMNNVNMTSPPVSTRRDESRSGFSPQESNPDNLLGNRLSSATLASLYTASVPTLPLLNQTLNTLSVPEPVVSRGSEMVRETYHGVAQEQESRYPVHIPAAETLAHAFLMLQTEPALSANSSTRPSARGVMNDGALQVNLDARTLLLSPAQISVISTDVGYKSPTSAISSGVGTAIKSEVMDIYAGVDRWDGEGSR
ncbi:hypothetical protein HDU79_009430 [Rhizoclosmatium sp. JEL0117]|nr:hypothetical protein HDU79_009430 [Rhizoclosmatium sp. JEL0117]